MQGDASGRHAVKCPFEKVRANLVQIQAESLQNVQKCGFFGGQKAPGVNKLYNISKRHAVLADIGLCLRHVRLKLYKSTYLLSKKHRLAA